MCNGVRSVRSVFPLSKAEGGEGEGGGHGMGGADWATEGKRGVIGGNYGIWELVRGLIPQPGGKDQRERYER